MGAANKYPTAGARTTVATNESNEYRKHRGFMFALLATLSTSFGHVYAGLVPLLLLF